MATKQKWYERLFGKKLIKCDTVEENNVCELVDSLECLKNSDIIIIYFSFANINAQNDDVTKTLVSLYNKINVEHCCVSCKRLEVVQVVLWVNNDVFVDFESSHRENIVGLPWYAVPFSELDLKTRLSRRYRIKVGVPTLVVVDADGSTITCSGKERLAEDPLGDSFPWRPRPVDQVLRDVNLVRGRQYGTEHPEEHSEDIRYQDLPPDIIRGFYFSANWCPPCRAFTPQLVDIYRVLRKKEPGFEVIFVSSDRSAESFDMYMESMPWLAIPWQQANVRTELAQLYAVRGIPTLLLVDGNGHVITHDARAEIIDDPLAQNFPWKPRPVNILTERYAAKLHDYPAIVLFIEGDETELQFADSVLAPAANTYYKKYNINFNAPQEEFLYACGDDHYILFLIGLDSDASDLLRDLVGLDDVVPLLVALDIPNNRFAIMDYGQEITVEAVSNFVEEFQKGDLEFRHINEELPDSNKLEN